MRDAAGEQLLRIAREVCEALELSPHAHAVLDLDGRIVAVNATLLRWTGRAGDIALVGTAVAREGDVALVLALTRARYGESVTLEVREVAPFPELAGSFRLHLTPVRTGSRVVGVGLMLEDVGHRGSASSGELPFREMVDAIPSGLLVERAGVVLYANGAALGLLGYGSLDELVGLSLYEIVRAGVVEELRSRLGAGGLSLGEVALLRRDGRVVSAALLASPLELGEARGSLLSLTQLEPTMASAGGRAAGSRDPAELCQQLEWSLSAASDGIERATEGEPCAAGPEALRRSGALADAASALTDAMNLVRRLADEVRDRRRELPDEGAHPDAAESLGTVLVCDDESRLAMLTAGLLDQYGFSAVTVPTGEEALTALGADAANADVVLLDLNLPDQGADDVLRRMRECGFRQPVILTSGYAEEDVAPQLLNDPQVTAYLAKPYSVEHLVSSVRRAIGIAESSPATDGGQATSPAKGPRD